MTAASVSVCSLSSLLSSFSRMCSSGVLDHSGTHYSSSLSSMESPKLQEGPNEDLQPVFPLYLLFASGSLHLFPSAARGSLSDDDWDR